ncbi:hypothetical protein NIES2100_72750 [Calothrix sp. NIES-2100]|uniref:hypothetical protein n=1 Tax=Calothrix sp. NIES-2100 TaxID=1954172 RepID=UPI000B5FD248|nr:hypothetical protein NIES2100_72750 [Calothrix sp. NIES-2100]
MNEEYPTDLQVSQDLKALSIVINNSIAKAENILNKAKEIDKIRELIQEIHLSRKELLNANNDLKQVEEYASNHLVEARNLQAQLKILQEIPNQLQQLGISEDVLRDLELVIHKINNATQESQSSAEESHNILLQVQVHLQTSQKILQEVNTIKAQIETLNAEIDIKFIEVKKVIDIYSQKNQYTQNLIQELNRVVETIGGEEEIKNFIQDVRNTRLEINHSEQQLISAQQQMITVQGLENYLNKFHDIRNRKQLWRWLWNELGFVGVIVYLLSLITPKRKK